MKNYGIREAYVARTEVSTVSEDATHYWNEQRIAASASYQYYVYEKAAQFLLSSGRRSFVDVGCGYPKKAREMISPITSDITLIDHPSLKVIMERDFPEMKFVPVDLERGDNAPRRTFDCVVCADVVEHLLDPDPLIALLRRLLAPDGRLFLSTPERDILRGRHCLSSPKPEHIREWSSSEFRTFVINSGLGLAEHHLLPQKRLNPAERATLPILKRILPRRYLACQLAVCGPQITS